jgi:hypothetical protein
VEENLWSCVVGKLLDLGIFVGSLGLMGLLLLFTFLGVHHFIDLTLSSFHLSFYLPVLLGAAGILVNFVGGEIDRKKLAKNFKPFLLYKLLFYLSIGVMMLAVALGAIMNPQVLNIKNDPLRCSGSCPGLILSDL